MVRKERKRPPLFEVNSATPADTAPGVGRTGSALNQFELAYEAIEELLVNCELRPGRFLALQELQQLVKFGRTPVHQAVSRLAADTLITMHPRRGLQIAPIDLARERVLLRLRRDMERFVIRLATEHSSASHRNQMLHMKRHLRENRERHHDRIVQRRRPAPRPAVSRRRRASPSSRTRCARCTRSSGASAGSTTRRSPRPETCSRPSTCTSRLLDAVANRHVDAAIAASDELIEFVDSMFDVLEREIDPSLLDCSLGYFEAP